LRRIFAVLLVTPLLASCSDSVTPVAPSGAVRSAGDTHSMGDMDMPAAESWPTEANWWTPGDVLAADEGWASGTTVMAAEATTLGATTQAAPATGEVVSFGHADVGTTEGTQDNSFNARDKIVPGTVVIDRGQTVTFNVVFGHRVAIYDDGTMPADIQHVPGEGDFVLDPNHRLFLQPFPTPQFKLRFVRPGKYLMLCAIGKHFFLRNQWGFIIVR
jgi:hypothetical protein